MTEPAGGRCVVEDHCITCGDHAVEMRVVGEDVQGLTLCADDTGAQELVDTTLVAPVSLDDRVLVHAGVALTQLEQTRP